MLIEQLMNLREIISTPISVLCFNMNQQKVCSQEFWNILSGLDIQLDISKNGVFIIIMKILKAKIWFKVAKYDES